MEWVRKYSARMAFMMLSVKRITGIRNVIWLLTRAYSSDDRELSFGIVMETVYESSRCTEWLNKLGFTYTK